MDRKSRFACPPVGLRAAATSGFDRIRRDYTTGSAASHILPNERARTANQHTRLLAAVCWHGPLRFRDAAHPVSAGAVDFALDDEVYDGLHVVPEARVLAESEFLPPKSEPGAQPKTVPQVWALEKDGYRAFTSIPGLRLTTFSVPAYRALLLRGIARAGRREQIAEFCTPDETAALQARGTAR